MKVKLLLIFLILLTFSVIGCVDDTEEVINETDMLNETAEEVVNETITDDIDMNETVVEEEVSEEEEDNEPLEIIESTDPKIYTIYLKNFNAQPNNLTINTGDIVMWFNDNDPVRTFTLVSNEGLWENESIVNRRSFKYTFNESGTYAYNVLTWDKMKGTIIVK